MVTLDGGSDNYYIRPVKCSKIPKMFNSIYFIAQDVTYYFQIEYQNIIF